MLKRVCSALTIGVLASAGIVFAAPSNKKQTKPASLLEVTRAEYKIVQGDVEFGSEVVTKKTFDNNTIVYLGDIDQSPGAIVRVKNTTELTLSEDSHFMRTYAAKRVVTQGEREVTQGISIRMYANVAVSDVTIGENTTKRRIVVPAGAALLEQAVANHFYQLLFWYDREVGGRQNFQTLDPLTSRVESAALLLESEKSMPVNGKDTAVAVFKLERERAGETRAYVDADGLIVRFEFGLMVWDLVSVTIEPVGQN